MNIHTLTNDTYSYAAMPFTYKIWRITHSWHLSCEKVGKQEMTLQRPIVLIQPQTTTV